MIAGLLLFGFACLPAEERRLRRAVELYDRGRAALDQGAVEEALADFQAAGRLDPQSRALVGWQAEALARLDRVPEALALLDPAILAEPEDADLRYVRARLRARAGQLDEAGVDLLVLASQGRLGPGEASSDPDLRRLAERPDLAALIAPPQVEVRLQASTPRLLVGDELELVLEVRAPAGSVLDLRGMGEPSRRLRRQRVVEDERSGPAGSRVLRLLFGLQALGPGQVRLGPWLLSAGGSSALTDAVELEILAVGQRRVPAEGEADEELRLPSASLPAGGLPAWTVEESRVVLWLAPDQRAEVEAEGQGQPLRPTETWELRREGQPAARALVFPPRPGLVAEVRGPDASERRRLTGPEAAQSQ